VKTGVEIVLGAIQFAQFAHRNQRRKYSGEHYFVHLAEVAAIVSLYDNDPEVIAAAYLHDSVEDQDVDPEDIARATTPAVSEMVWWLTDSPLTAGNRTVRKALDNDRLWRSPPQVQTIKYGDSISNTRSIVKHDPRWAPHYLQEKRELLKNLNRGNPDLHRMAVALVEPINH
jgi:guanosine-3',5'-bis(diphosphate) 3'-pyrophosphohydrolase